MGFWHRHLIAIWFWSRISNQTEFRWQNCWNLNLNWWWFNLKALNPLAYHLFYFCCFAFLDETSLIETVMEGSEKITLHGNSLGKLLLQKGEINKLCYLLVSKCATENITQSSKYYEFRHHPHQRFFFWKTEKLFEIFSFFFRGDKNISFTIILNQLLK